MAITLCILGFGVVTGGSVNPARTIGPAVDSAWKVSRMTEAANGLGRALVAEFIGTFALTFIGAGAAIALGVNHDPPVAFAHGLTILVFVAAFGDISGGHFNPAVTTGLAVAGVFPSRRVVPYLIAQPW
jgi:glycerol uptake facilitator-like aquaporin